MSVLSLFLCAAIIHALLPLRARSSASNEFSLLCLFFRVRALALIPVSRERVSCLVKFYEEKDVGQIKEKKSLSKLKYKICDWQDLAQKFKLEQFQLVYMSFERLFSL